MVPTMKKAYKQAYEEYRMNTDPKVKMLDNLILLSIGCFVIQVVYGVLFNRDPFNSFIAGVFCSLGTFGMSASFRIQLTDPTFDETSNKKKLFEYCMGTLLVFFSCLLLMG